MQTITIKVTNSENKMALKNLLDAPLRSRFLSGIFLAITNDESYSTFKFHQKDKSEACLEIGQLENAVKNLVGSFVAAKNLQQKKVVDFLP